MADDLSDFSCQNPLCADYGQRGRGNLTACARYGKHLRRLLYCKTCKARFSERKGTPLFGARLSDAKALAVLAHLADGCGVRQTSRLAQVGKNTVARYCLLAGDLLQRVKRQLPPADAVAVPAEAAGQPCAAEAREAGHVNGPDVVLVEMVVRPPVRHWRDSTE
jgi:transposase-like protein